MHYKRRDSVARSYVDSDTFATEYCQCLPLSSLSEVLLRNDEDDEKVGERMALAPREFNMRIRTHLEALFPRTTPLSLFLLHVSQLEHIAVAPQGAIVHKRQRYHAPASFLEQVMSNVRRAIRDNEQILVHEGVGAAIIFPHVECQGIRNILERIYNNVSLLQAETVIPRLQRQTDVMMGISSYPEPGNSLEQLLYQASVTTRRFTLRPAITNQLWDVKGTGSEGEEGTRHAHVRHENHVTVKLAKVVPNVPYMQLPAQLPTRLKQLVPYHVACELRCAPVGRDHQCLTVAMADPGNAKDVHYLRELTGLTIFPVACDPSALNALLTNKW
jgi:GGDEF domain-containing protein